MTRFWDGRRDRQTDGVTALLDLLSPLATQVKIKTKQISHLSNEDVPSGTQGLGSRCTEADPHHPGNLTDDHLHGPHVIQD